MWSRQNGDGPGQAQRQVGAWSLAHFNRRRASSEITALLLAIEVLSPSTAQNDRVKKRRYFSRNEVPEYWIVDCDARVIERWRPTDERPEIISERLVWNPVGATEPFTLDLAEFFADVFGEDIAE